MRFLTIPLLLAGCPAEPTPCPAAAPLTVPVMQPVAITDAVLGIETDYSAQPRTLAINANPVFDGLCANAVITFAFDPRERSHVFACGEFVGSIGSGGPLVIRFDQDTGAKYVVLVRESCDDDRAELIVSADRSLATVRCPSTGDGKSYEGDSAFVDYVIR